VAGFAVFAVSLALNTGALAVLHGVDPRPSRRWEASALVLASRCATVMRSVALSVWVFDGRRRDASGARQTVYDLSHAKVTWATRSAAAGRIGLPPRVEEA
jgi:hypothetical protein